RHVELGLVLADEQHRQLALESVDHCSHRHPATSSSCTSDSFRFDVSESLLCDPLDPGHAVDGGERPQLEDLLGTIGTDVLDPLELFEGGAVDVDLPRL